MTRPANITAWLCDDRMLSTSHNGVSRDDAKAEILRLDAELASLSTALRDATGQWQDAERDRRRAEAELTTLRDALTLAAAEVQAARDERDEARGGFDLGPRRPNVVPLLAHMDEIDDGAKCGAHLGGWGPPPCDLPAGHAGAHRGWQLATSVSDYDEPKERP